MGRCAGTAVDGGISWRIGPDDAVGIVDKHMLQGLCALDSRPGLPSACVLLAFAIPSNRYRGLEIGLPQGKAASRLQPDRGAKCTALRRPSCRPQDAAQGAAQGMIRSRIRGRVAGAGVATIAVMSARAVARLLCPRTTSAI